MNNSWGMVRKNYIMHITMGILCALVAFVGSNLIGTLLGLLIYLSFIIMQYGDGCDRGERASTMQATVDRLKSEGKQADERMLKQVYMPKEAVKAFILSSVPLALLAAVNLILANPQDANETTLGVVTRVIFFPAAWLTRIMTGLVSTDLTGLHTAETALLGSVARGGMDLVKAVSSLSGIAEYGHAYDLQYLTIMRALYIPISFMAPLAMLIGYLQGPRLRLKKLEDIKKGSNKKRKKLKVFNKKRAPRQLKPEV